MEGRKRRLPFSLCRAEIPLTRTYVRITGNVVERVSASLKVKRKCRDLFALPSTRILFTPDKWRYDESKDFFATKAKIPACLFGDVLPILFPLL